MDIFGWYNVELKAVNILKPKSMTRNTNNKIFADRVVNEVLNSTLNLKIFAIVMDQPDSPLEVEAGTFPNHWVDGFAFHEKKPEQIERDKKKRNVQSTTA